MFRGGKSLMNGGESGEDAVATSNPTGPARATRSRSFFSAGDRSSASPLGKKKPRLVRNPADRPADFSPNLLESPPPQERASSPLAEDFLEPLAPETSLAMDSFAIRPVPHSLPRVMSRHGRGAQEVCRQFWKAGDFTCAGTDRKFATGGMDHVRVHPKFLHSNATSHKWALGALAELLDNAIDEVANGATAVNVDMSRNPRNGDPMLVIEDNGGGMDPDCIRRCMSLGYSAKSKIANTIGQYGNGFKTGTMRLGADAIVFSRRSKRRGCSPTQSIGMLSYTFLTITGLEDIIVPIVDYEIQPFGLRKLVGGSVDDWNENLETIKRWSPYSSEGELLDQIKGMSHQGTRIVIYNLWEDEQGLLELDFMQNPHDIQVRGVNRDEKNIELAAQFPNLRHYLTYRHSLRSYASILYLHLPPEFKIFLRGKQVEYHRLSDNLMFTEEVTYRPQYRVQQGQKDAGQVKAVVTIGFVKDAKEHIDVQGFSVYHKNRLIKPFWRIWNTPDTRGRGIIGILEANFVEPAHDKQGFERTLVFTRLETRLIEMQKSYWSKNCHKIGYNNKSLKKDGKANAGKEGIGTGGLGLERSSHTRGSTQELEVQGGAGVEDGTSSPARLELQPLSFPVPTDISSNKHRSQSDSSIQTLGDLPLKRPFHQAQDVSGKNGHPQVASSLRSMNRRAFLSREIAAVDVDAETLETEETSNPRSPKTGEATRRRKVITTQAGASAMLNLNDIRLRPGKDAVTSKGDVHLSTTNVSPEKIASTRGPIGDTVDVDAHISVVLPRRSAMQKAPGTSTACNSHTVEVEEITSLSRLPISSRDLSAPDTSVPGLNEDSLYDLTLEIDEALVGPHSIVGKVVDATVAASNADSLEKMMPEIDEASLGLTPFMEKVLDYCLNDTSIPASNADFVENLTPDVDELVAHPPSSAEKALGIPLSLCECVKLSSQSDPKSNALLENGHQVQHKSLGDLRAKKAAGSVLINNDLGQEGTINGCMGTSQNWEDATQIRKAHLEDLVGVVDSVEQQEGKCVESSQEFEEGRMAEVHSSSHKGSKSQLQKVLRVEKKVLLLRKSIKAVDKEADSLREQLHEERQLGHTDTENLKRQLETAQLQLDNLKTENSRVRSLHQGGLECGGPVY